MDDAQPPSNCTGPHSTTRSTGSALVHPMPADDDSGISPFAYVAGAAAADAGTSPLSDPDAAALAAEAADDLAPLPDATGAPGPCLTAAGLANTKGQGPSAASGSAAGVRFAPTTMAGDGPCRTNSRKGVKRKLIPLKQVVRHSYEYHGLNDLFFFCITALAVTMVLYWHWGETTATFKATIQHSFQQYGNPDWQSQQLNNVDTMYDAVEYSIGWLEFWLQRADNIDWSNQTVRVGEFGDVKYARMLVNVDRNCDPLLHPSMECFTDDETTALVASGQQGGQRYENLLHWSGWENLGSMRGRDSANAGTPVEGNKWWSYTIIAPKFYGQAATRDNFIGRMYNITRNTNLNYNNCDWANSTCSEVGPYTDGSPAGPKCAQQGPDVPFSSWWSSTAMCRSPTTMDKMPQNSTGVKRGQRYFVRDPRALANPRPLGIGNVVDLKPFLSKYAYSIALDVLAANAVHNRAKGANDSYGDRALFTLTLQRSAQVKEKPDRILWQITSTVPVRFSFYSQSTDVVRIAFEALLYLCLLVVLSLQVWQVYVCYMQHNTIKAWFGHFWNCFEALSNITLLAWVIFYWVLYFKLRGREWDYDNWDVDGWLAHNKLNAISQWAASYSAWLYMGIVVDFLICLRLARYMRIHVGLKAFYQVFLIAAREFLDFAVFLFYILVLLGSAVFAFFQLTGGNYQFLRFPDGLSLMSRLTFGFLSYDEFQSQALGVGAAVSAVTLLFWVAVLLLVVYTQNIILAIVAEAYEEAKAKLGTAETSFLMLVLMRILFLTLFVIYRIRMLFKDILYACLGWKASAGVPSLKRSTSTASSGTAVPGPDGGPDGNMGPGSGLPPSGDAPVSATRAHSSSNGHTDPIEGLWGGEVDEEEEAPALAPTVSRAVLPLDVEQGLAYGSLYGTGRQHSSHVSLLAASKRTGSHYGSTGTIPEVSQADDTPADSAQRMGSGVPAMSVTSSTAPARKSFRQRLSTMWHDVILGERHILRMYKDVYLAPATNEDSWVRSWKERYWRPWCVARTEPLRCLMNLYQDFGSYKLKEECTWMANDKAKAVIAATWRGNNLQAADEAGLRGSSSVKDSVVDDSAHDDAESRLALMTFPVLLTETYVDEDTLARLFLVTSHMSSVLKIWVPPFHPLTATEVSYLVKGISEVYGVDEDMVLQQGGTAVTAAGVQSGSGGLQPAVSVLSSTSSEMRDAQLGRQRKSGGGFFTHLNMKRRDGAADHNRQLTWLLHANKRLEEATIRNAAQLKSASTRLSQQMVAQEEFQRKQQRTNSQLLRGMEALTAMLQAQHAVQQGQPTIERAGPPVVERTTSSSSSTGPMAGGSSGARSAVRRINTMAANATSKMLSPFAGSSQNARGGKVRSSSALGESAALLPRCGSDLSNPASPTAYHTASAAAAGTGDGLEQGGQHAADEDTQLAAGSDHLVQSLQEQLEQQQKALELQQELLQQVLARLPPPGQQQQQ